MPDSLRRFIFALLVFALATIVFVLMRATRPGYGLLDLVRGTPPQKEIFTGASAPKLSNDDVPGLARLDEEYAKLSAAVLPSVVSVNTRSIVQRYTQFGPFAIPQGAAEQSGIGSGAIISKEGHIITNYHVIEGAQEVQVTTNDNKKFRATVLNGSKSRDIALLKITSDRKDFPALSFANSDKVRVGQVVFAVGNPFGLTGTVTQGIISARDRVLSDGRLDYLQTDTVINPGNSGGPLVNVRGEIIGINVAIYRGDQNVQSWQGVGLAVPGYEAKEVIEAILALGSSKPTKPKHGGYLGISVHEDFVSTPAGTGIYVRDVNPDSPAQTAGLQPGDVILDWNGERVQTPREFLDSIALSAPGTKFKLKVLRGNQVGIVDGAVGTMPQ